MCSRDGNERKRASTAVVQATQHHFVKARRVERRQIAGGVQFRHISLTYAPGEATPAEATPAILSDATRAVYENLHAKPRQAVFVRVDGRSERHEKGSCGGGRFSGTFTSETQRAFSYLVGTLRRGCDYGLFDGSRDGSSYVLTRGARTFFVRAISGWAVRASRHINNLPGQKKTRRLSGKESHSNVTSMYVISCYEFLFGNLQLRLRL